MYWMIRVSHYDNSITNHMMIFCGGGDDALKEASCNLKADEIIVGISEFEVEQGDWFNIQDKGE